ncbi:DUF6562 domain-containing protein [Bacteroides sp. 519]|uniref:DUF6562 domain-containing protein n=1 Tax=Bacteroides sp. 519 TaxID=2302937 RepID=UPI0013D8AC0E|nr:DUF6562 domain-containing protein [Bacteroides sp. 519]NDV59491.1 hypothetical protein [Bacteroides sp. 519]
MKKQTNWLLLAAALCVASCQNDENYANEQGMVDFTVKTTIPQELQTRALSSTGGANNVNASLYDLRYTMEVWTKDANPKLAYRDTKIVADNFTTTPVAFNVRLQAAEYNFAFWADFVDEGTTADLHYTTNAGLESVTEGTKGEFVGNIGLRAVELKGTSYPTICDDTRDAFYAVQPVNLKQTSSITGLQLKRPFGKFRLVSVGDADGHLSSTIKSADFTYKKGTAGTLAFYSGFNVLDGDVITEKTLPVAANTVMATTPTNESIVIGGTTYSQATVIAFDYLFASKASSTVAFSVKTYNHASEKTDATQIGFSNVSEIPVQLNKLTTVVGNLNSENTQITINISDSFEQGTEVEY